MKKTLLLSTILFSISLFAQYTRPYIQWTKNYGGTYYDNSSDIKQTIDGGYIFVGTADVNSGVSDIDWSDRIDTTKEIVLVKLNMNGIIEWKRYLGGSQQDVVFKIQLTSDSGYITVGYTYSNDGEASNNHGSTDVWVTKLEGDGTIQWHKCYGGLGSEFGRSIKQTSDGGYIIAASSGEISGDITSNHPAYYSSYIPSTDFWIIKIDGNGNIQWQRSFGGSGEDELHSAEEIMDEYGNTKYVVSGHSISGDGDVNEHHGVTGEEGVYDVWVAILDSIGNIEIQRSLGGTGYDIEPILITAQNEGYIIASTSSSNDGDVSGHHGFSGDTRIYDMWVVKVDDYLNIEWQKSLGGVNAEWATSIIQNSNEGYIVVGQTNSSDGNIIVEDTINRGGGDGWMVKLNSNGNIEWQKLLGGSGYDYFSSVQQISDGSYIAMGTTYSSDGDVDSNYAIYGNFPESSDVWVVKLSNEIAFCKAIFSIYPDSSTTHNWIANNLSSAINPLSYTWYWGDGDSSIGVAPSHTYSTAGYYNICLRISDGLGCEDLYCDSSTYIFKTEEAVTVNVINNTQTPSSISETSNNNSIFISPNPSHGKFTLTSDFSQGGLIEVYNITGSRVETHNYASLQHADIDISNQAQGVYLVKISNASTVWTQRIVVE